MIAALFLLMGVWSIWDMAFNTHLFEHKIDPTIFCLPVGIGLLRLRSVWRRYALACIWLGYALLLLMLTVVFAMANWVNLLLVQSPPGNISVDVFGWKPNAVQATWVELIYFLASAALLPWMHVVLMRPKIKALFEQQRGRRTDWLETLIVIALVLFTFTGGWTDLLGLTTPSSPTQLLMCGGAVLCTAVAFLIARRVRRAYGVGCQESYLALGVYCGNAGYFSRPLAEPARACGRLAARPHQRFHWRAVRRSANSRDRSFPERAGRAGEGSL